MFRENVTLFMVTSSQNDVVFAPFVTALYQGSGEANIDTALVQYEIYGTLLLHSRAVGYVIIKGQLRLIDLYQETCKHI